MYGNRTCGRAYAELIKVPVFPHVPSSPNTPLILLLTLKQLSYFYPLIASPFPPNPQPQIMDSKDESGSQGSQVRPKKNGTSFTDFLEMIHGDPSTMITSIAAYGLTWITLGGFLFLPGSFPKIDQIVLNDSGGIQSETNFTGYVPL